MYGYRKKNIIMIVMMAAILFMAVGYAILSTTLNISGFSDLTGEWGVKVTNITFKSTGRAYNISDPVFNDTSVKFWVGVKEPGDKMTFFVTVQNYGNIDALLESIDASSSGTESIIYSIEGINNQEVLKAGETKKFTITTYFDINATELPSSLTKNLTVKLNYVQYDDQTITSTPPVIEDDTTQYGIMYVANGGTGTMTGTVCTIDKACRLDKNTYTREGYEFKGWSTTPTGRVEYEDYTDVTNLTTKGKTISLYAVWLNNNLVQNILFDNIYYADNVRSEFVDSDTGINLSQKNSDTNGKGLYYTSTNTENNRTTYYFRGDVNNNYVKFGTHTTDLIEYRGYYSETSSLFKKYESLDACNKYPMFNYNCEEIVFANAGDDMYWRIIRINEDGSIRLIYQGTTSNATGIEATIGAVAFNSSYKDNAYVGYMYGTPGSSTYEETHANINDSTIKTYIDNWYINRTNLSSYSSTHLADSGFCNDRIVANVPNMWSSNDTALGYGQNVTYYGAYNRLSRNREPQFACSNESNDLFTTSTSSKGNKALTYPIGLITADELWYAGAATGGSVTHYLYTGSTYKTMSPGYFDNSNAFEWGSSSSGVMLNFAVSNDNEDVRPVINLSSAVLLSSELPDGCTKLDGTASCPYIIEVN